MMANKAFVFVVEKRAKKKNCEWNPIKVFLDSRDARKHAAFKNNTNDNVLHEYRYTKYTPERE